MIIRKSINDSFKYIKKRKYLFITLFLTQALFLSLISTIFAYYAINIYTHVNNIIEPMQQMTDITSIPTSIFDSYKEMIRTGIEFITFSYIIYILVNGVNWDITNAVITNKVYYLKYLVMFAVQTVIFTLPAMIIINMLTDALVNFQSAAATATIGVIISVTALYFMYISYSNIPRYKISQTGTLIKESISFGLRQWKTLIPTYIIMNIPTTITIALLSYYYESSLTVICIIITLMIISINWSRIYFLATMKNITLQLSKKQ